MKRIRAACLEQTLHFQLREELGHDFAVREVQAEYEKYKRHLEKTRVRHQIMEEQVLADGSILVKLKKQYNGYDTGDYMD